VSHNDPDLETAEPDTSRTRWIKRIVIGGVAAVVLVFGGIFIYANFINDSPDELDEADLANALVTDTTADTPPVSDTGVSDTTNPSTPTESAPTSDTTLVAEVPSDEVPEPGFDGDWVPTDASEFGYRVEEVLAGVNATAVGRSNEISGLLTIDATTATALDVEVQIESITSDDSLRDGQFRGRIMNAEEFPTAAFTLTEPIDFGSIPTGDDQITATATGDLTLKGVTNSVTFDVTAQTTGQRIGVLGSIPVLFTDYGIDNPSFGAVRTEDDGLVEFVLVFEPA